MRADQLKEQPVIRVESNIPQQFGPECRLVVYGIHGGSDFVTAVCIGSAVLKRRCEADPFTGAPPESADQLRLRAQREIVPHLGESAQRDVHGSAVGYFRYSGLPNDHCKKASLA